MLKKHGGETRINLASNTQYVYALIDPRDDAVRYVGITRNVYIRLNQHTKDTSRADNKTSWVLELERLGLFPELEILETIEANPDAEITALECEKYWIRHFLKSGSSFF